MGKPQRLRVGSGLRPVYEVTRDSLAGHLGSDPVAAGWRRRLSSGGPKEKHAAEQPSPATARTRG